MIDPNMERWIKASVNVIMRERIAETYILFNGEDNQTADKEEWLEIIIQGPTYRQASRRWHRYEVSVLIGCVTRGVSKDIYRMARLKGKAQSAVSEEIAVTQRGDNDDTYIGCLVHRDDVPRPVDGMDFGQVDSTLMLERSTVEAHFVMILDN
jgi:hypothetical protein